jgi:hypothetical protein
MLLKLKTKGGTDTHLEKERVPSPAPDSSFNASLAYELLTPLSLQSLTAMFVPIYLKSVIL